MSDQTGISWTDATFNPWWGCTKVSPGCANCYAETLASNYSFPVWGATAPRRKFHDKHWRGPINWNRQAMEEGIRRKVFCASMCDVFEDYAGVINERLRLWDLIRETPWLDWQLLTKRPENIRGFLPDDWGNGYDNVWLGTSVENQELADKRIPILENIPAVIRFLSVEPILGKIDLEYPESLFTSGPRMCCDGRECGCRGQPIDPPLIYGIAWVIVGGESGHKRRPCEVAWIESIVAQCKGADVACFVKQDSALYPGKQGRLADEIFDTKEFPRALSTA